MADPAALDLIELLTADHRNLEEVDSADLVRVVLEHLWVERELLHPAVREHAEGGEEIADSFLATDDRLEDRLADLEEARATTEQPEGTAEEAEAEVRSVVAEHIAGQEGLFPKLEAEIPQELLTELAEGVPLAMGGAPTRPHGDRPEGFLGEMAEDVAAAADHLRRLFHHESNDTEAH
jgi:hypothetical protein